MEEAFEKLFAGLAFAFVVAAAFVIYAPLGTAFGALGGWIVGWFFDDTLSEFFSAAGFERLAEMPLWKIGAGLGFIGGFFRAYQSSSAD